MNSLNQALEEVKRREDLADNILVNLIKLEKSIDILQRAIKLPPKEPLNFLQKVSVVKK